MRQSILSRFLVTSIFLHLFFLSSHLVHGQEPDVELVVLGIAQDAGYPQIDCYKPHCLPAWKDPDKRRLATSLGLVDHKNKNKYLFEATPDIKEQFYRFNQVAPNNEYSFKGIFLTHGHMGHYTGLMHLGREAAGSKNIPVFAMPRMLEFLKSNGPWSQLVSLNNIKLKELQHNTSVLLGPVVDQELKKDKTLAELKVVPILVPHRDEFTETVGYKIVGPNRTALFIPDIDKWKKWKTDINKLIKEVDVALLDATFFDGNELPNRNMSEVPHPFVTESMIRFSSLSKSDKNKIVFIHFNHSNPLLIDGSRQQKQVEIAGFRFAIEGMRLPL